MINTRFFLLGGVNFTMEKHTTLPKPHLSRVKESPPPIEKVVEYHPSGLPKIDIHRRDEKIVEVKSPFTRLAPDKQLEVLVPILNTVAKNRCNKTMVDRLLQRCCLAFGLSPSISDYRPVLAGLSGLAAVEDLDFYLNLYGFETSLAREEILYYAATIPGILLPFVARRLFGDRGSSCLRRLLRVNKVDALQGYLRQLESPPLAPYPEWLENQGEDEWDVIPEYLHPDHELWSDIKENVPISSHSIEKIFTKHDGFAFEGPEGDPLDDEFIQGVARDLLLSGGKEVGLSRLIAARLFGPMNSILDHRCLDTIAGLGCRMLTCKCRDPEWLVSQSIECYCCGQGIRDVSHILRKPLLGGGWYGCYCSVECLILTHPEVKGEVVWHRCQESLGDVFDRLRWRSKDIDDDE